MTTTSVTLRNGSRHDQINVTAVMFVLNDMTGSLTGWTALEELVGYVRGETGGIQPLHHKILEEAELVDANDTVHQVVRDVVLSAFEGRGLSLKIVSPVQDYEDE